MSKTETEGKRSIDETITDQPLFRSVKGSDSIETASADIELDWNTTHYKGEYLMLDVWVGEDHVCLLWIDEQGVRNLLQLLQERDRDVSGP